MQFGKTFSLWFIFARLCFWSVIQACKMFTHSQFPAVPEWGRAFCQHFTQWNSCLIKALDAGMLVTMQILFCEAFLCSMKPWGSCSGSSANHDIVSPSLPLSCHALCSACTVQHAGGMCSGHPASPGVVLSDSLPKGAWQSRAAEFMPVWNCFLKYGWGWRNIAC